MQKLRHNRDETRIVARKLLDSKRKELEDSVPRKDIMSLLGLLLPFLFLSTWLLKTSPPVKSSVSQREDWRLTDEEIISQVR